jgi:sugar phosphate isomerase/epimerase
MRNMDRRAFLGAGLASIELRAAARKIDWPRLSVLTDEVAKSEADAIAFCKQYDLKWVELRAVPGVRGSYYALEGEALATAARQFKDAKLGVSFLNTGMLKFDLPGTVPVRRRNETPEQRAAREKTMQERFDRRMDELRNVRDIRVFTFTRVEDPAAIMPRIAEILAEMTAVAEKADVRLLVENEGSCNVAVCSELVEICKLIPSKAFGINWDPVNELGHKAVPFPDGYNSLPKARIGNVQMKARALVVGPDFLDWRGIFDALAKDGYPGKVGLETHVFDGTLIEKAHLCMQKLKELTA